MKTRHLCLLLLVTGLYACSKQPKTAAIVTTNDYDKGVSFLFRQNDSAFYYFNKVVTSSRDSLEIAMAYTNLAFIQSDAGDYFGGQESLLLSLRYLDEQKEKDNRCLLSDYNELGSSSLSLKNYDAAIGYYNQALKFTKDDIAKVTALNNKAVAYQKMQQYSQAIAILDSIIDQSRKDKSEYARVLSNLARTKWLQNAGYQAAPDLLSALRIREQEKDDWGLNASYSHLADYYSHSQPDSALFYARKMYAIAHQLNSPDDELEALEKLIPLSAAGAVQPYFARYHYLSDSLQTSRNAAKNQFALIRYGAEKSKADNLKLQKENAEKKVQIIQQYILIVGIVFFLIVILIIINGRARKRKQQVIWESENAIRENRLKTSQKVHDVVANGLYRVMTELEHQDELNKEQLLDKIEILYEQSRDISYEQPDNTHQDFHQAVTQLLNTFADPTRVFITGNYKNLWTAIQAPVKNELLHVLQELMVNMKKHSAAESVVVKFEQQGNQLKIQYADDGIGLTPAFNYGNGLTNTENRITGMGGRINFASNIPKGLKIDIYLPIA